MANTTVCFPLFSSDPLLQLITSSVNLTLIFFTLFLSTRVHRKDVSRLFTLWLYIAHCSSDIVQLFISILQLQKVIHASGLFCSDKVGSNIIPMVGKLFQDFAAQVYRILALLMVFMTYTSYKYPMAFQELFGMGRRNKVFFGGLIFIVFYVLLNNTLTLLGFYIPEEQQPNILMQICYYFLQATALFTITLMMILYILSIRAIKKHVTKNRSRGDSTLIHRRQLSSVIVYASAPNAMLLPNLFGNIVYIWVANVDLSVVSTQVSTLLYMAALIASINRYCTYIKIPIITISTYIAFSSYKRALLALFKWRTSSVHVITSPSHISTSRSVINAQNAQLRCDVKCRSGGSRWKTILRNFMQGADIELCPHCTEVQIGK
uniref:G protein-coupled receptor n=1 Tax=Steinernema glaseri TaxID=37863 RepID=A0A1I7ZMG5_9BILA